MMYHPTTRVLAVLALLQAHGRMSGSELAGRLEVNIRTLRRYIIMLQDLGIPIEAERGRNGAYILSPGFKLPPMMFTNEEALALTVGLISARRLNLADADRAVESALAKLERVLPLELKGRVRALNETITLDQNPASSTPPGEAILSVMSSRTTPATRPYSLSSATRGGYSTRFRCLWADLLSSKMVRGWLLSLTPGLAFLSIGSHRASQTIERTF